MKRSAWFSVLISTTAYGAGSILNGGTHAATLIGPAITAVGGTVDTSVFVDRTSDPPGSPSNLVTQSSVTAGTPYFSVASSTADNHAVYTTLNMSYAGYTIGEDNANYATLVPQGTMFSRPFARAVQPAGTPPPIAESATSSPNSGNGGTGNGIEFALSASYKGLNTTADSWVSAEMSGLLAQLQVNHPTWTWGDIKGALRQTAANWVTGYDPTAFGYGAINWDNANAIASTASIFLQPPILLAGVINGQVQVTIYPMRTSRRDHEVVYAIPAGYSWPVKDEYAQTDINNLVAAGGVLVFTGNTSSIVVNGTPSGDSVSQPGTHLLAAFTTDNAGHYSRFEPAFSTVTTPAIACL